jgi:transcriptional regulator of acetoin/glycerol metabolism
MNTFRWRACFQGSTEPIFILNRHRRILFVNHAWEQLTGIAAVEARHIACRRRRVSPDDEWDVLLAHALRPPDEVLQGQTAQVRRLVPHPDPARRCWEVDYLPFCDESGLHFLVGRIIIRTPTHPTGPSVLPQTVLALRETVRRRHTPEALASEMPAMRLVLEQARLGARVRDPVFILGEIGVGKTSLAHTIHASGAERARPFVKLDCARLPVSALIGVLFGEGEFAQPPIAATVYLSDPNRLPREIQLRLCHLLSATSDAGREPRIIAGMSAEPAEEIREGRLLEELACRLGTLTIRVPPLRERRDDLSGFTERLLERIAGKRLVTMSPAAWDVIRSSAWPRNVIELYEVMLGALDRSSGDRIEAGDLPLYLRLPSQAVTDEARPLPLQELLEAAERRLISLALRRAGGNKTRAAESLRIWRPLLLRRMDALGIPDPTPPRKTGRKRPPGDAD